MSKAHVHLAYKRPLGFQQGCKTPPAIHPTPLIKLQDICNLRSDWWRTCMQRGQRLNKQNKQKKKYSVKHAGRGT